MIWKNLFKTNIQHKKHTSWSKDEIMSRNGTEINAAHIHFGIDRRDRSIDIQRPQFDLKSKRNIHICIFGSSHLCVIGTWCHQMRIDIVKLNRPTAFLMFLNNTRTSNGDSMSDVPDSYALFYPNTCPTAERCRHSRCSLTNACYMDSTICYWKIDLQTCR